MSVTTLQPQAQSALPFEDGQMPLPDFGTADSVETGDDDQEDDDWDKPYRPVENQKLPLKERDFPIIMRQQIGSAPTNRKVPIFISGLSPLGALATRVRLTYPYDIQPHAILLQTIIEAPPSTGKRCFANIVNQIMEPTLEHLDKQQRRAEQEYREKKNGRK